MEPRATLENWAKTQEQLSEARRFLQEGKPDEALYFTWLAAENLANTVKVLRNHAYLKEHKEKATLLKTYFALGFLKKDYSLTFARLSRFRIAAAFHPYTSIPKQYTAKDVSSFLKEIEELQKEAGELLRKKGLLK